MSSTLVKRSPKMVGGEGSRHPLIMAVGECPGDVEDKEGKPFVGPAGKLLRSLLDELGIGEDKYYLTNAVKYFKYVPKGKRRLHQKPNAQDIRIGRPALEEEIKGLKPRIVVALGATAATSLCGRPVKIKAERAKWLQSPLGPKILVSWHPSAALRAPDPETRKLVREQLKSDLKKAWAEISDSAKK